MNRIKTLRKLKSIDQKVLALDLKVSQPTISDWENGRKKPSAKSTEKLADYFGVSVDYLLGRPDSLKGVQVPVLGRVQAGIPIEAVQEIIDYEEITPELAATGEFFCLQVKGDSMEPKFSNGDVVVVKKQSDAEGGSIVVAIINGNDATIKKLKKTEDGLMLISTNPHYDPMFFSNAEVVKLPIEIIGKVIELRAKFN